MPRINSQTIRKSLKTNKPLTVYIVPGFDDYQEAKPYRKIAAEFRRHGCSVVVASIAWKYQTITSYVTKLLQRLNRVRRPVCLFGFSLGAMASLVAAQHLRPELLFLCSISPYFKEDRSHLTQDDRKSLGKRRVKDLLSHSFRKIAGSIQSKTLVVAGSKESSALIQRARSASNEIDNCKLILVRNGVHSLGQRKYLSTVKELIGRALRYKKNNAHRLV